MKNELLLKRNLRGSDTIFNRFVYFFIFMAALLAFFPFWLVFINSFATESSVAKHGYQIFPSEFSLAGYQYMFNGRQVFQSYRNTIIVTAIGTLLSTLISSMFAYVLAHPKVKYRNALSFATYLAMILGSGLVGFYIMVSRTLGLKDTLWALIFPYLLNPFFTFIMVAAYRDTPYEIHEAASIDGANDIYIFFRIIWPIVKPCTAVIGLFYALQFWNDWWLSLLFIDNFKLHTLQMMIRQLISNINAASYVSGGQTNFGVVVPSNSIKMVVVCVTIGPVILLYPFIQRFFVKGITIGAVKG